MLSYEEPESAHGWYEDEAPLFAPEENLSFFSCQEEEQRKRDRDEALPQPWQREQQGALFSWDFMQCEPVTSDQLVKAMFSNSVTHAGCDQATVNAWVAWSYSFTMPSGASEFMRKKKEDADQLWALHSAWNRYYTNLNRKWLETRDPSRAEQLREQKRGYDKIEWVSLKDFSKTPRAELDAYVAWLITQPYNKETPVFAQYRANNKRRRVAE